MTRSKIRENVFKMLFRVEFHDKSELAEQMELLNDELTMHSSMRSLQAGRPIVWQRLIWQLSDWQFMR